jgi:uncharacterized membrane protein
MSMRSRLRSGLDRLDGEGRAPGVDLARGLAVVGMLAAHMLTTVPLDPGDPGTWTDVVNGRSSILFATLAGVSLALTSGGTTPAAGRALAVARGRTAVRAAVIWAIGIVLVALGTPVYVILPAYGILFLLAMPVLGLRAPALFAIAAIVGVAGPFLLWAVSGWAIWEQPYATLLETATGWHYPFLVWFAFVAAGLGVGRLALSRATTAGLLVVAGTGLALLGYGVIGAGSGLDEPQTIMEFVRSSAPHGSGIGEVAGSGGVALAVIGACVLLCATPVRWIVLPLRALGSMPLTAYAAQLVAWAIVQPEPTLLQPELLAFRALEPFWPFTLVTMAACTVWALLVGRGPLEAGIAWLARTVVPSRPAVAS